MKSANDSTREPTLKYEGTLPPLPVPKLEQTCEKYLESVKVFVTDDEFRQTEFVVDMFRTGVGKILQQKLEERARKHKNWISKWWNDTYARYRGPLPFISNMGGCTDTTNIWQPQDGLGIYTGAMFLYFMLQKYIILQKQEWPVAKFRKTIPMDMTLWYGLFATSRMPGTEKDTILEYFLKDGRPTSEIRHIVVIKKRRFFTFDVFTPDFESLSVPELERQFRRISAMVEMKSEGPGVGSLTAADRPTWKTVQDHLFALDANNRKIVDIINKAVLVFVLDDQAPKSSMEAATECILGDCYNRWFDKGMQLIALRNGHIGINMDHAHFDGTMANEVIQSAIDDLTACGGKWKGSSKTRLLPEPIELEFTVDEYILNQIESAQKNHNLMKQQAQMIDKPFTKFGKQLPKDNSVHPDAFIQMAIQLAYYRLHKRCVPTYESATVRQFHHGRTETARSCNTQSHKFVKTMCSDASNSTKVRVFREACEYQNKLMNDCCDGKGIDRHLFGLKTLSELEGIELPLIFTDKAWKMSGGDGNYILSTSLAGYCQAHGGMAPITLDGYGVYYTIENDRLNIVCSTFGTPGTDCSAMYKGIETALCDLKDLLISSKL